MIIDARNWNSGWDRVHLALMLLVKHKPRCVSNLFHSQVS